MLKDNIYKDNVECRMSTGKFVGLVLCHKSADKFVKVQESCFYVVSLVCSSDALPLVGVL